MERVVSAGVFYLNSTLLMQNYSQDGRKWFETVGGTIEDEKPFEAMEREFGEETGTELEELAGDPEIHQLCPHEYSSNRSEKEVYPFAIVLGQAFEPEISEEHIDSEWFSPEEVRKLNESGYIDDGYRKTLELTSEVAGIEIFNEDRAGSISYRAGVL